MERQSDLVHPLETQWERARGRLPTGKYDDEVLALVRHAFFLGAAKTLESLIHSGAPTLRLITMRMELRKLFGEQRDQDHQEAA